jgi:hypothetical protein
MNIETLKSRLQKFDPLILSTGQQGTLRVLEKSARVVCDIAPDGSTDEEQIITQVDSILSKARDLDQQPPVWLSIHLLHEAIAFDGVCRALIALTEFLGPTVKTQIVIHLDQPFTDWSVIQSLTKSLLESSGRAKEAYIELIAPFGEFREAEMEALFDLGVRIRFAAGWTKGCAPDQVPTVNTGVLRSLSELGFRTTIEWYVHAGNIQAFEQQIPNLLVDNHCSGFSLPLVSQNPYYRFGPGFPALPDALEYCQLLTRSYKQYPYYDDVFSPLTDLALLIRNGGWDSKLNTPTAIHLLLDREGRVGLFKQSAALAQAWTTVSEVITTRLDTLRDRFLEFAGNAQQWEKIPYCRECEWRYICGGLDASSNCSPPQNDLDTMCGHRKLFLEHFATLRAPDHVIGSAQKK